MKIVLIIQLFWANLFGDFIKKNAAYYIRDFLLHMVTVYYNGNLSKYPGMLRNVLSLSFQDVQRSRCLDSHVQISRCLDV